MPEVSSFFGPHPDWRRPRKRSCFCDSQAGSTLLQLYRTSILYLSPRNLTQLHSSHTEENESAESETRRLPLRQAYLDLVLCSGSEALDLGSALLPRRRQRSNMGLILNAADANGEVNSLCKEGRNNS